MVGRDGRRNKTENNTNTTDDKERKAHNNKWIWTQRKRHIYRKIEIGGEKRRERERERERERVE